MRWIGSETFNLTRLIYQRGLALILLVAFLNAAFEFKPLLGEHGLQPVPLFTRSVPFSASPSLFFFAPTDTAFTLAAWLLAVPLFFLRLPAHAEGSAMAVSRERGRMLAGLGVVPVAVLVLLILAYF